MKKLTYLLLAILLMLSVLSLAACGGGDDDEKATSPQSTQQNGQSTATSKPTQTEKTPAVTPKPTDKPTISGLGELGDVVSMDDLKSYKMHMVVDSGMGGIVTDMEAVNDPPPKATYMKANMGSFVIETITIGDKSWTKVSGQGWMEGAAIESDAQEMTDISDYLDDIDTKVDYIGKDKVNGVNCKHYNVEMDATIEYTDPDSGTSANYNAHFTGEIWVADESSLPKVMVRQVGTMDTKIPLATAEVTMDMEIDVTNINDRSISISPPPANQITKMPDIPTIGGFSPGPQSFEMPCSEFAMGSQDWMDCMMSYAEDQ